MPRVAWLTDLHLNFLSDKQAERFCVDLARTEADCFAFTGDIGEAPNVERYFRLLESSLERPIYFVLGNHDFYRGSIAVVRKQVRGLCKISSRLHWMPEEDIVALSEQTCLVGHDGWGDARAGNYWESNVVLNDWELIGEFFGLSTAGRQRVLQQLGDEAALYFRKILPKALKRFKHVIVLTHVPPFPQASLYKGQPSNSHGLPHFCCQAVGEVLQESMTVHPKREMTVLCGHTHEAADVQILPNLRVFTGGAAYGHPKLERVLEVI